MATWREPKTNWIGTDGFAYADMRRITGNAEVLSVKFDVPFTPYAEVIANGNYLTASDRNNITDFLESVYRSGSFTFNRGYVAPRVSYGSAWNSRDLNNIEKLMYDLYYAQPYVDRTFNYAGDEIACGDTVSVGLL